MRVRNIIARRLVPLELLDATVSFYEALFAQPARLRFEYPDRGLRLAQVAQLLVIGGSDEALAPFRGTAMTLLVDDIEAYAAWLPRQGAVIVRPIRDVPTGRNMLVEQPDGAMVEYVEHARPDPADDVLAAPF